MAAGAGRVYPCDWQSRLPRHADRANPDPNQDAGADPEGQSADLRAAEHDAGADPAGRSAPIPAPDDGGGGDPEDQSAGPGGAEKRLAGDTAEAPGCAAAGGHGGQDSPAHTGQPGQTEQA